MNKETLIKFIEDNYPNCSIAYRLKGEFYHFEIPSYTSECWLNKVEPHDTPNTIKEEWIKQNE